MTRLTVVVAATKTNGIGQNGQLPWKLSSDLKYFAKVTTSAPAGKQNAVIMGRKTWDSIPLKFRPLPKRLNIVISRNPDYELSVHGDTPAVLARDLQAAMEYVNNQKTIEKPIHRGFIIGGASIYSEAFGLSPSSPMMVDRVLLTRILAPEFNCDVSIPDFLKTVDGKKWMRASHAALQAWVGFEVPEGAQEDKGVMYEFQMWTREARGE